MVPNYNSACQFENNAWKCRNGTPRQCQWMVRLILSSVRIDEKVLKPERSIMGEDKLEWHWRHLIPSSPSARKGRQKESPSLPTPSPWLRTGVDGKTREDEIPIRPYHVNPKITSLPNLWSAKKYLASYSSPWSLYNLWQPVEISRSENRCVGEL